MSTPSSLPPPPVLLSVGKIAKELGISTATINFYVQQGLLPPPRKLSRTRAVYGPQHLRILRLIQKLKGSALSLAQIKQMFSTTGYGDEALTKLESIGYLQPLASPKLHGDGGELELFDPVALDTFARLAELDESTVGDLEDVGLLRPLGGRYDARDLQAARTARLLLDVGVPLARLAELSSQLVTVMRTAFPMTQLLALQHADALHSRELRFRDILEPFVVLFGYFFNRVADSEQPGWRAEAFAPPPRPASVEAPQEDDAERPSAPPAQ